MAEVVNWKEESSKPRRTSKNGVTYLRLESGRRYTIRPAGESVHFFRFFVKNGNETRTVVADPKHKDEYADIISKKVGREIPAKERYAVNIIDREDGAIKVLECGPKVFENFFEWANMKKAHPGGKAGTDWSIKVSGDGINREYIVMPLNNEATFTADEVGKIKAVEYSLEQVYKATPKEEIMDRLFGDRKNKGKASDESVPSAPVQIEGKEVGVNVDVPW